MYSSRQLSALISSYSLLKPTSWTQKNKSVSGFKREKLPQNGCISLRQKINEMKFLITLKGVKHNARDNFLSKTTKNNLYFSLSKYAICNQCHQIGRFIALWATFQSLWYQLFCPNCPHFEAFFVKVSKSFIVLAKSFLGNFYRHLATIYWSHCM